ncbi:hypothetical protein MASR2M44_12660 [Bacteroidota bacterium]
MKRLALFVLVISIFSCKQSIAQKAFQLRELGHWNNPTLPRNDNYQIWNDLTGYVDPISKKEYIIMGSTDSIYFFDVSDPTHIRLCDVEDGRSKQMVNRDYECYRNYVYCVSDNRNPGSLQVFDLRYLPDSVHKVYDSDSLSFNTHSIFIDSASKRLYLCINRLKSGGVAAMDIMSLENPERPQWIGRLQVPTFGDGSASFRNVHEVFVRNDTAYCSVEYNGLYIFDLRDLKKQQLLSIIKDYPQNGYNHSSYVNAAGNLLMFTDEIPGGLDIKLFDIKDIFSPKFVNSFHSTDKATAHNAWFVGQEAFVSYYQDGFYIFDISNPLEVKTKAWFHSHPWPVESYEGWKGCWGVYPLFPSGNIAISDMGEGLFLLKRDSSITGLNDNNIPKDLRIWPNPSKNGRFNLDIPNEAGQLESIEIRDFQGKQLLQKRISEATFDLDCSFLNSGFYLIELKTERHRFCKKIQLIHE